MIIPLSRIIVRAFDQVVLFSILYSLAELRATPGRAKGQNEQDELPCWRYNLKMKIRNITCIQKYLLRMYSATD